MDEYKYVWTDNEIIIVLSFINMIYFEILKNLASIPYCYIYIHQNLILYQFVPLNMYAYRETKKGGRAR